MLDDLIKKVAAIVISNAVFGLDQIRQTSLLNQALAEVDAYVTKNGASELNTISNPSLGAIAFDMLRRNSKNTLVPAYSYLLYTQDLLTAKGLASDTRNEALLKKAYILIGSEWPCTRSLLILGAMGTELIHMYDIDNLLNVVLLGTLLSMDVNYLRSNDAKLWKSMVDMRTNYRNLTDQQLKNIAIQHDRQVVEFKEAIFK